VTKTGANSQENISRKQEKTAPNKRPKKKHPSSTREKRCYSRKKRKKFCNHEEKKRRNKWHLRGFRPSLGKEIPYVPAKEGENLPVGRRQGFERKEGFRKASF